MEPPTLRRIIHDGVKDDIFAPLTWNEKEKAYIESHLFYRARYYLPFALA